MIDFHTARIGYLCTFTKNQFIRRLCVRTWILPALFSSSTVSHSLALKCRGKIVVEFFVFVLVTGTIWNGLEWVAVEGYYVATYPPFISWADVVEWNRQESSFVCAFNRPQTPQCQTEGLKLDM